MTGYLVKSYGVRIAHVFRKSASDPSLIFNKLPPGMYPEYREVHKMMRGTQERGYQVFSETSIKEIFQNRRVILNNNICLQVGNDGYFIDRPSKLITNYIASSIHCSGVFHTCIDWLLP